MNPPPLMWSDSQRRAFDELIAIGETFFGADWLSLPLRPRFDTLVIGPSGSGKSHLVRAVAEHLNVPCLRVCHGEWIVMGARPHLHPTVQKIAKFIVENERGIIHVDELDKARSGFQADWTIAVFAEIFSLLDRMMPAGSREDSYTEILRHRLRCDFWFLGSGTWQAAWEKSPPIGFVDPMSQWDSVVLSRAIRTAGFIPTELLNRFSDTFIFLKPATERDFQNAAEMFGLVRLARELGEKIDFAQAVEENLGARWLEKIHAELLMAAWRRGRRDLLPVRMPPETEPSREEPDDDIPI